MVQNWKAKEIKLREFCFPFLLRSYPSCPGSLAVCTERKQEAPLTYVKNPLRTLGFASSARSWEELLTRVVTWPDCHEVRFRNHAILEAFGNRISMNSD